MGRKTYEVGMAHGLVPGQPAYPGRPNYVFSSTMTPDPAQLSSEFHLVAEDPAAFVAELKQRHSGAIWLCGGSRLAGTLLSAGLVDELVLKVNPTLFGDGLPLAAQLSRRHDLSLLESRAYDNGVVVSRYALSAQNG